MVVLEGPLKKAHPLIDAVMTPSGNDVAMVHFNECSTKVDGWINLFGDVLEFFGAKVPKSQLFTDLYELALNKEGGVLARFMRERLIDAVSELGEGLKILTEEEGVQVDYLIGHGGYFKSGQAGRTIMSETLGVPIHLMSHSSEGGAWGMAVLAAFADAIAARPQCLAELRLENYVNSIFDQSAKTP
jgi:hypothetical protein